MFVPFCAMVGPLARIGKPQMWVRALLCAGSVLVHVLTDEARALYDMEELWGALGKITRIEATLNTQTMRSEPSVLVERREPALMA
jgi:Ribosomal silencing factor during starvation